MRTALEKKIKALIVDDEQDVCFLLGSILEHKNLHAGFVNSLTDAKRVLESEKPAIIFLDNHLPDGFGISFIRDIREKHPQARIIMITAQDSLHDKQTAMNNGADHFIGKPFTRDIIHQALENFLN
jgi:two-component system response regulator RegA